MSTSKSLSIVAALAAFAAPASAQKPAAKPVAPSLTWAPAPAPYPAGAKMAVVSGDPTKSGVYTVQFSFPDGYVVPPHMHPTDEIITVKSGVFSYGMGDAFNAKGMKALKPGEHETIPATSHHFANAMGATVVEVSGTGPFAMTIAKPGKRVK